MEFTCMPGLQQSASGCTCPLQAGSGNTWCLWAGWWWIPGRDGGHESPLEAPYLSPAEHRTLLASSQGGRLSMFTLVFSTGSECKISTLCLSFCLVHSVPTTPGLPNQTWGSSVRVSVTLSLYRKRKSYSISKPWKRQKKKKDCPRSQISLWKAVPFRNGAGRPRKWGRRAKGGKLCKCYSNSHLCSSSIRETWSIRFSLNTQHSCGTGYIKQNALNN